MMFLQKISVLALLCPPLTLALTYWVDDSCRRIPPVLAAIDEAITMARIADQRLRANDPDIQYAFATVFNTPTSNTPAVRRVDGILAPIGSMTPEPIRERSNLRIYCNQRRWVLQDDRHGLDERHGVNANNGNFFDRNGRLIPNSARDPEHQVWVDRVNHMIYLGDLNEVEDKVGETYTMPIAAYNQWENSLRNTMTLFEPYTEPKKATVWQLVQERVDLTQRPLIDPPLYSLLSETVLHEMTHMEPFDTDDVEPAYDWDNAISHSPEDALNNAENYGYFGLLAALGLAGYILDRGSEHPEWGELKRVNYVWRGTSPVDRRILAGTAYERYL